MKTIEEIRTLAGHVAAEMLALANAKETPPATGGGSRQRGLPEELRRKFVEVRAALFQRGIFDPLLVRFDTATVSQASTAAVAEELVKVAAGL